jgi:hypothetical protein
MRTLVLFSLKEVGVDGSADANAGLDEEQKSPKIKAQMRNFSEKEIVGLNMESCILSLGFLAVFWILKRDLIWKVAGKVTLLLLLFFPRAERNP